MEVKGVKIRVLGKGSYGVVYLFETTSPASQLYAVKSANYTRSSSLLKERQILKELLGCPNIVRCFGGFTSVEHDDQTLLFNLFLEYASGGTLLDLMNKHGGKIPECDVKGYTRMILEGLADIHVRGYVHSDLKPANILVFPSDHQKNICGSNNDITLKIADFGLAKQCGEIDNINPKLCFRGTPQYMSPESIEGEISGALDVWSLGCIVVQMISGKLPWECGNQKDLMKKLLRGETPKIPQDMSSDGKDFLAMCFARDPSDRWTANMLLSHPFLLLPDEFSYFSYGGPPKFNFSFPCSTSFQDGRSFMPTKSYPDDHFSFFSYRGVPTSDNFAPCV